MAIRGDRVERVGNHLPTKVSERRIDDMHRLDRICGRASKLEAAVVPDGAVNFCLSQAPLDLFTKKNDETPANASDCVYGWPVRRPGE